MSVPGGYPYDIEPAVKAADIIYIAVGTPMSKTGEADLTYIKAAAQTIGEQLNGYKIIVTKSTVPVGTESSFTKSSAKRQRKISV